VLALESSPIVEPLRAFTATCQGPWEGTATQLLNALAGIVGERATKAKIGPRSRIP
jgi:hypothetical protein